MNAPPIGLIPKQIHDEGRVCEIIEAIRRYQAVDMPIPAEWYIELGVLSLTVAVDGLTYFRDKT